MRLYQHHIAFLCFTIHSYLHSSSPLICAALATPTPTMVKNLFTSAYYKLEQTVAARSIPKLQNPSSRIDVWADTDSDAGTATFDHSLWDAVLKRHVQTISTSAGGETQQNTAVDYVHLAEDKEFFQYLDQLEKAPTDLNTRLSPRERMAFWMNAYNAVCVSIIVQELQERKAQQPTENTQLLPSSILDITSKAHPVIWDRPVRRVAATELVSLNAIEHDQLRQVFQHPEVHACIVCASASCPDLRPEAYTGPRLREQMADQTRLWLANRNKGCGIDEQNTSYLSLSRIFLWFENDFGGGLQGVQAFCQKYVEDPEVRAVLEKSALGMRGQTPVRYLEYNWQLNRVASKDSTP